MKKNPEHRGLPWHTLKKGLLMIKWSLFFFCIGIIQVFAVNTYSQQTRFSMKFEKTKLENVLNEIENQSEYYFLYNQDYIDVNQMVDIHVKDQGIGPVLNQLLESTGITYSIYNRQIVLTSKEQPSPMVSGQGNTVVKGEVVDSSGSPLPGVTAVVKGTTNGTITNVDGKYSLSDVPGNATLVFSFVGMKSQEIQVNYRTQIDVKMEEETIGIEEIVAVGYGTQRRSEITGAIASVKGVELEKMPVQNVGKALTGMAPGLRVFDVDGDPSRDPVIQIRGESTASLKGISTDTQPLIVIDGTPGGSLREIASEDIESIEILKDAAAATVYGSRGANGVILISTKRGKAGKLKISVDSYFKYNLQTSKHEIARPYDHALMLAEGQIADHQGLTPRSYQDLEWLKDVDIDYLDGLFFNTWSNKQRMSVSGGNAEHQFRLSGTYDRDLGTTVNNEYTSGTFLFNSDHKLGKRLSWSNTFTYRTYKRLEGYSYEPRRRMLASKLPYIIAVEQNNPQYFYDVVESGDSWAEFAASREDWEYSSQYSFTLAPTYKIMEGLELSDRFNYRQYSSTKEIFNYKSQAFGRSQTLNDANLTYGNGYSYVNDVVLNFNHTFAEDHQVYATAVWSVEKNFGRWLQGYRYGLPLDLIPSIALGDVASMTNSGGHTEDTRLGIVGRVGYTYKQKYVLAGSVRRDASSRFTPDYQWGTFPSASFAWNISKEPFMAGIGWLTDAKIRGSWGKLGRDKLGLYQSYSLVNLSAGYGFNNTPTTGAAVSSLAYSGTGWEAVETVDLGFETYLLNNRLKFSYNYWTKTTKDMIFAEELPWLSGLRNLDVSVNGGELFNGGHEIELQWKDRIKDFQYHFEVNASTYKSEVKSWNFPEGVDRLIEVGRDAFAIAVGQPFMTFLLYQSDGLWQSDAEIDAAKYHQKDANGNFLYSSNGDPLWGYINFGRARPEVGGIKFVDRSGDGNIDQDDMYYAGQRYPKLVLGINGGFEYKGFDFYVQTNAHMGQSIYVETHRNNGNVFGQRRYVVDLAGYQAWTGEGSTNAANRPRFSYGGGTRITNFSDANLYKGDYFRIKVINIGYTFKQDLIKQFGISSVRLYVSGYNVLTFTKYPGFDPEVAGNLLNDNYTYAGFARPYPYANPTSFGGGIQVNF